MNQTDMAQNESRSSGPVIGIVIVILLLVAGALYAWKMRETVTESALPPIPEVDVVTEELETVGTSTESADIEEVGRVLWSKIKQVGGGYR